MLENVNESKTMQIIELENYMEKVKKDIVDEDLCQPTTSTDPFKSEAYNMWRTENTTLPKKYHILK